VAGHDGRDAPTLLLANPNNPDGRIVPPETLRHGMIRWPRGADGWWWTKPLPMPRPCLGRGPCGALAGLVVLRSFGKFFGLAGLRLGFVLGPDAVMALRALLGDWPLGAAALAHGTAAYRDPRGGRTRGDLARRASAWMPCWPPMTCAPRGNVRISA
jgi:cobalamin biosynthetic protein CobC